MLRTARLAWEPNLGTSLFARRPQLAPYLWPAVAIGAATACFWSVRFYVDRGQASLLYLPIVLACAIRFGFGSAVLATGLSFLCWDYFLLPPFHTLKVADSRDWISLTVFLLAALMTARLAAQARAQTQRAQAREAEIATLFQASETISREIKADRLLAALTEQLQTLCHATRCVVLRRDSCEDAATEQPPPARTSAEMEMSVPLHASEALVGVLQVGGRDDGRPYSGAERRIILTLANHAAVVIARDLLAEQAAQAAAMRESDALKDSLLSLVSHELQTPLAAIKVSASGLLQPGATWEEADRMEALRAINSEADRLGGLVGNLLDLSRLEGGAWRPAKDWCDVAEVAGTALDRLPPAEAARVELADAPDLPLIRADYTQIALVLTNLLENAVKYSPPGGPILLHIQPADSGVTIRVQDGGAGLLPGEEARLFERFYRGRRHYGSEVHGTGLGLALCRAVVQAHGGRIEASNAPAGGAVFSVFLPTE